jgi:hypothetical protein
MQSLAPAYLAELGRQLASISAFLGGFSITFFGTLLTIGSSRRVLGWALGSAAFAAGAFAVTAITATMLITSFHPSAPADIAMRGDALVRARFVAGLSLVLGMYGLLFSLALSGWIRSWRIGVATTAVALLSGLFAGWALVGFR